MQNFNERKWFVIYTKPRWEKKITRVISQLGIESYCPLNRVEKRWSDRKKLVMEPLFKSYVFVRVTSAEQYIPLQISGVYNYVCEMKKPAQVQDHEIEDIRRFLAEHGHVMLKKIHVEVNDAIQILYGPFMDKTGQVTRVDENFVKVVIRSLGYSLVASVRRTAIRKMDPVEW